MLTAARWPLPDSAGQIEQERHWMKRVAASRQRVLRLADGVLCRL